MKSEHSVFRKHRQLETRFIRVLLLSQAIVFLSCTRDRNENQLSTTTETDAPKNEPSKRESEKDVIVALIDMYDDVTLDTIQEELKSRGIACYIEGSVGQSVSVAQDDAAKAREIIRESKRINHEQVRIVEPE